MRNIYLRNLLFWGLLFSLCAVEATAQQEALFSQFEHNQMYYNPAYAGHGQKTCAQLLIREQNTGFGNQATTAADGNLSTQYLTLNAPINWPVGLNADGGGIGLSILNDQADAIGRTGLNVSGSYKRETGIGLISGGLNIGFIQTSIEGDFQASDPNDPIVEELNSGGLNDMVLDVGFGAYLTADNYYAGVSTLHLNEPSYSWTSGSVSNVFRVFYLVGGYKTAINEAITFEPAAFVRFDKSKWQIDLNPAVHFAGKYWAGIHIRSDPFNNTLRLNEVSLNGGVNLSPRLKLGYNYDLPTSELSTYAGSHEFFVRYCFDIQTEPVYQTPERNTRDL